MKTSGKRKLMKIILKKPGPSPHCMGHSIYKVGKFIAICYLNYAKDGTN